LTFEWSGAESFADRLGLMSRAIDGAAREAAIDAAEIIREEIPRHVDSRDARGREPYASTFSVKGEPSPPSALLFTEAPYARVLEYGIATFVAVRGYRRGRVGVRSHSKRMHAPARRILGRSLDAAHDRAIEVAFGGIKEAILAG
jgi:hypothetical protein